MVSEGAGWLAKGWVNGYREVREKGGVNEEG